MAKEKRIEAIEWIIEQADAVKNGIVGLKLPSGLSISTCETEPTVHLYGNGFDELAVAASQTVKTELFGGYRRAYFLFDGVKFYQYVYTDKETTDAES